MLHQIQSNSTKYVTGRCRATTSCDPDVPDSRTSLIQYGNQGYCKKSSHYNGIRIGNLLGLMPHQFQNHGLTPHSLIK